MTVTIKVAIAPGQPVAVGLTVTVATTGIVPGLNAVYPLMLSAPVVPKPTLTFEVQVKLAPGTPPVKWIVEAVSPLQCTLLAIGSTVGLGLTVTWKVSATPVQPLADGVTITVEITVAKVAFEATYGNISPVLAVPKPTFIEDVQVNVVPATSPVKLKPPAG